MAVIIKKSTNRRCRPQVQYGTGQFSTTDTTCELPVDFDTITAIALTPLAAYGANNQLSLDETVAADGTIKRPTTGTITVTRNSSGTSGLKFAFIIHGY